MQLFSAVVSRVPHADSSDLGFRNIARAYHPGYPFSTAVIVVSLSFRSNPDYALESPESAATI